MPNFLHVITDAASSRRGKFVLMALWLLLVAVLVGLAPKLASIYNNTATQDIPPDAPLQVAQRLLLQEFPNSRGTPEVLVFYDARGLSNADLVQAKRVSDWLVSPKKPAAAGPVLSVFTVPQAKPQLVSKDRTTMTIIVPLAGDTSGSAFQHAVTDIRAYLQNVTAHTGLQAYAIGPAGVVEDAALIFSATDLPLLLGTVGLVLVLLILLYRSPILALLTLLAVGWALQVVNALIGFAGQIGLFGVSQQATSIMTVLLIVPLVLVLVGLVLALLLRSLVAPLYLLGAVTLNFLATIGACEFFFQHIAGQDGYSYAIPLYTFIFLVALGADYTIFLMARVREEARRHGLEAGVPYAVSRTGGVITSAGLILAGTFAVLTTLPLNVLYQFGVCVAVGVLMDTFIVRGLLVPGVVLLLGRWNWWPSKLPHGSLRSGKAEDKEVIPVG